MAKAACPDTQDTAELTVLIVSYNTRDLTLAAIRTLLDTTRRTRLRVIVWDNASKDGSADAVAASFPMIELVRSAENIGFAAANNRLAGRVRSEYMLLLNPDTEVHEGAVDRLMEFARQRPQAGIWGGRTVFPDGRLNPGSCWGRITAWSLFCSATGLTALFRKSEFFNPEGYGGWARDSIREVDIVQGCFFLIRKPLWDRLGGFDLRYWMYGEEADLCLRAQADGWRPAITPEAQIMHLAGAASTRAGKVMMLATARNTLIRDHWPRWKRPLGVALMWCWAALRMIAARGLAVVRPGAAARARKDLWDAIWRERHIWLRGYGPSDRADAPGARQG